jgi:hypothetical protein
MQESHKSVTTPSKKPIHSHKTELNQAKTASQKQTKPLVLDEPHVNQTESGPEVIT